MKQNLSTLKQNTRELQKVRSQKGFQLFQKIRKSKIKEIKKKKKNRKIMIEKGNEYSKNFLKNLKLNPIQNRKRYVSVKEEQRAKIEKNIDKYKKEGNKLLQDGIRYNIKHSKPELYIKLRQKQLESLNEKKELKESFNFESRSVSLNNASLRFAGLIKLPKATKRANSIANRRRNSVKKNFLVDAREVLDTRENTIRKEVGSIRDTRSFTNIKSKIKNIEKNANKNYLRSKFESNELKVVKDLEEADRKLIDVLNYKLDLIEKFGKKEANKEEMAHLGSTLSPKIQATSSNIMQKSEASKVEIPVIENQSNDSNF